MSEKKMECNWAVIGFRHVRKKKRCYKCGRFLGDVHYIIYTFFGMRKEHYCSRECRGG